MIRAILERGRDRRAAEVSRAVERGGPLSEAAVLLDWVSGIFSAEGEHAARIDVHLWAEALASVRVKGLARTALEQAVQTVQAVAQWRLSSRSKAGPVDPGRAASILVAIFLGLEIQRAVGVAMKGGDIARTLATFFSDYLPAGPARAGRGKVRRGKA